MWVGVVEFHLEDRLLMDRYLLKVLGQGTLDLEGGKRRTFASCLVMVGGN